MKLLLKVLIFICLFQRIFFAMDVEQNFESSSLLPFMNNQWQRTLHQTCRLGTQYYEAGKDMIPVHKIHCELNKKTIKGFLGESKRTGGLLLGPGPANDLDIPWFLRTFSHVIMIDGNLDAMNDQVTKLATIDPQILHKVTLRQEDLTGGFYELLEKPEMAREIEKVFQNYLETSSFDLSGYEKWLENNLRIDLSSYASEVVIVTLVASQLYGLASDLFSDIAKKIAVLICEDPKKYGLSGTYRIEDFDQIIEEMHEPNSRRIESMFFKAIAKSKAQRIYFSETMTKEGTGIIKEIFDQFIITMNTSYDIDSCMDAWRYDEDKPVAWYTFTRKAL